MVATSVRDYRESYPDGKTKVTWGAGVGEDGRYLLQGKETWYYENGRKEWEAEYRGGDKTGTETRWAADPREWEKMHHEDGTYEWTVFGADGNVTAQSRWEGQRLRHYEIRGQ